MEGREASGPLHALRFEAYRQASTSWEDPWRVTRVAEVEELTAELAFRQGDAEAAWRSWRGGWWIRRLLEEEGGELRAHADHIMVRLRAATGRTDTE